MAMRGKIMCGTGHARNSHEWNMCRHKHAINLQKHIQFSP